VHHTPAPPPRDVARLAHDATARCSRTCRHTTSTHARPSTPSTRAPPLAPLPVSHHLGCTTPPQVALTPARLSHCRSRLVDAVAIKTAARPVTSTSAAANRRPPRNTSRLPSCARAPSLPDESSPTALLPLPATGAIYSTTCGTSITVSRTSSACSIPAAPPPCPPYK
jgi:hypothetical protein